MVAINPDIYETLLQEWQQEPDSPNGDWLDSWLGLIERMLSDDLGTTTDSSYERSFHIHPVGRIS